MAKFLTGPALTAALHDILEKAETELILISPYIKLHDSVRSSLLSHKNKHGLAITVVYGKNEDDVVKSMSREDMEFLTSFPNVRILYEKRLHAKYYANETDALVTSMNLHSYSQNNNIEAGILTQLGLLSIVGGGKDDTLDAETNQAFRRVIDQAELIFEKVPEYEKSNFGLSKNYTRSVVKVNKIEEKFRSGASESKAPAKPYVTQKTIFSKPTGYCIRTGKPIPFNPKRPMIDEAYQSWSKFSNPDYAEKFCHFSGEPSNGKTTFAKPILTKNWQKAKEVHGF